MICLENKLKIEEILEKFKTDIENENKEIFIISNSSDLWKRFQKYRMEILNNFPVNGEHQDENTLIIKSLKLEEFEVDSKNNFKDEKDKILKYISDCLRTFK